MGEGECQLRFLDREKYISGRLGKNHTACKGWLKMYVILRVILLLLFTKQIQNALKIPWKWTEIMIERFLGSIILILSKYYLKYYMIFVTGIIIFFTSSSHFWSILGQILGMCSKCNRYKFSRSFLYQRFYGRNNTSAWNKTKPISTEPF